VTTWQIYGPRETEGSWRRVAEGLAEGLHACGQRGSWFATDSVGHDLDCPLPDGFDADVGIFVGPPAHARMMRGQGNHTERWLMLAPNSTWLPKDVLAELERDGGITGYVTPSGWGKGILRRYTGLPVRVWHHGVTPWVRRGALDHHDREARGTVPPRSAYRWRCLHLSSSQAGRKSTHELVRAFVQSVETNLFLDVAPRLTVIVDGPVRDVERVRDEAATTPLGTKSVLVAPRQDLSPVWLGDLMASHDCVVQPSRSEGFGMVPLEARVAGVPVIMTNGTGHDAHLPVTSPGKAAFAGGHLTSNGLCVVLVGDYAPIDDGPDALAPTVSETAIGAALEVACSMRHRLAVWAASRAEDVLEDWSWAAVTRRFLDQEGPSRVLND
jgi:hypothetical protein